MIVHKQLKPAGQLTPQNEQFMNKSPEIHLDQLSYNKASVIMFFIKTIMIGLLN